MQASDRAPIVKPAAVRSITSPDDQSATFIELFFDLVFVFSVTQIVGLLHEGLTWINIGQALIIFWLVWWAWTQFTWALNAADTTNSLVELGTLLATGVAFIMAIALPEAFGTRALWFAAAYIAVRVIGLIIYTWVAQSNASQRVAVRSFALLSLGGFAVVLIGALLGGWLQYIFWGLAIVLDVTAAQRGASVEGWNIRPEHFGERHGLFTIIALGETLIVAAASVTGAEWTSTLITVSMLAVATTCALWWSYFVRTKPLIDAKLEAVSGVEQSSTARDAYTLLHFPMMCGIVAYAIAIEEAIAHPLEPLPLTGRLALALGLLLFVGGMALAVRRATGQLLVVRLALIAVAAVLIAALPVAPLITLSVALVGVVAIDVIEHWSVGSADMYYQHIERQSK